MRLNHCLHQQMPRPGLPLEQAVERSPKKTAASSPSPWGKSPKVMTCLPIGGTPQYQGGRPWGPFLQGQKGGQASTQRQEIVIGKTLRLHVQCRLTAQVSLGQLLHCSERWFHKMGTIIAPVPGHAPCQVLAIHKMLHAKLSTQSLT